MSLRFRRSINLGGGFRLNLSKSGVGISGGVRGARVGVGPAGARVAVGLPGTGLYYEKRKGLGGRRPAARKTTPGAAPPEGPAQARVTPGFFQSLAMPRGEKLFVEGINLVLGGQKEEAAHRFRQCLEEDRGLVDAYFALALATEDETERLVCLKNLLRDRDRFNQLFDKYGARVGGLLPITDHVTLHIFNDTLGLELLAVEVLEDQGELDQAVELLESSRLKDEPAVRLSLGELYFRQGKYQQCIQILQGIENKDMIGTGALYITGMAFREQGMNTAAIQTLREARRRTKDRDPEIIKEIRYSLAEALLEEGNRREARKEFERVLAGDASYLDVAQRLREW